MAISVDLGGAQVTVGPFAGLPEALRFVSDHVWDVDRYRHEYVSLLSPVEASRLLHGRDTSSSQRALFELPQRERRQPLEAVLRDRIAQEHGPPGDGPHGDGLYAHLDVHRPWPVQLAAEECWEGDCEHSRAAGGECTGPRKHRVWCRGCTALHPGGGEYGEQSLPECQVEWPCSVLRTMAAALSVPVLVS